MNFVRLAKFIEFGLKAAIFIVLLVVCIVFFMLEAIEKPVQGATWVDDKSVDQGMDVSTDARRTVFHFFISETSRDMKKMSQYHLNIFKSYVNFQNLEGGARTLSLPRTF